MPLVRLRTHSLPLFLCMCVYVYVCMYVCVCVYVVIFLEGRIRTTSRTKSSDATCSLADSFMATDCVCVCVCMYVCMCVCVYVCMCAWCVSVCMYVYAYIERAQINAHAHSTHQSPHSQAALPCKYTSHALIRVIACFWHTKNKTHNLTHGCGLT